MLGYIVGEAMGMHKFIIIKKDAAVDFDISYFTTTSCSLENVDDSASVKVGDSIFKGVRKYEDKNS